MAQKVTKSRKRKRDDFENDEPKRERSLISPAPGPSKGKTNKFKNKKSAKVTNRKNAKNNKQSRSQCRRGRLSITGGTNVSTESSQVCNYCKEWGNECDVYCEECFHSYHRECIKINIKKYNENNKSKKKRIPLSRAKQHNIVCNSIGFECANNEECLISFEFIGKPTSQCKIDSQNCFKEEVIPSTTLEIGRSLKYKTLYSDYLNKKMKKNQRKRKQKNKLSFNYEINRNVYKGYKYQNKEFKIGDKISIEMESGEEIARILDIFKDDDSVYPWVTVQWFWHASHVLQSKIPSINHSISNDSQFNLNDFELYFDLNYYNCYPVSSLNEKVTVVDAKDSFFKYKKEHLNDKVFWCVHSYDHISKRKCILPKNVICNRGTLFTEMTPVKSSLNNEEEEMHTMQEWIELELINASKKLMLSCVPARLPCRENEHKNIYQFMMSAVQQGGIGSGLYISGMPGTGKTATCRQIASELQNLVLKNKLPKFEYNEINAMKLPTAHHAYSELYKIIFKNDSNRMRKNGRKFKQYCAPSTAAQKLEKYFSERDKISNKTKNANLNSNDSDITHVLLIDELDYLLTRKQNVIYNLFDWPTRSNSKLIVIGIANTMDLPERLMPRVSSRLGLKRIVFKPYNRGQLETIMKDRLYELNIFSKDAIRYCASAVAGVSGDCRTALQICRRAVDLSLQRVKNNGIQTKNINKNNENINDSDSDDMISSFQFGNPRKKRRISVNNKFSNKFKNNSKNSKMEIDDDSSDYDNNLSQSQSTEEEEDSESSESEDEDISDLIQNNNNNNDCVSLKLINKSDFDKMDLEYSLVELQDIKTAKQCFDKSNDMQIVSTLSIFDKLFLTAIIVCSVSQHQSYAGTLDQYKRRLDTYIQTSLGGTKLNEMEMISILDKLGNIGLISVTSNRKQRNRWIRLNAQKDDVIDALKQDNNCAAILANVQFRD